MNQIITLALVLSSFYMPGHLRAQQQLTPREIQKRSLDVTKVDGTESLNTLIIINEKGRERVRKVASLTKLYNNGNTEKKLMRFISPADVKGTGFLTYDYDEEDDDKWIYMPALRKTRRIISSENAKSFMGSEFSYADMSMPTLDDYTYKLLGEKTVFDEKCYELEVVPVNSEVEDENGFSKKITYVGKANFTQRKAIYFNLYGEKEKVMLVKGVIELDKEKHKYRYKLIEIENILNGRKSIFSLDEIKFNPNISDEYFTSRYLEK